MRKLALGLLLLSVASATAIAGEKVSNSGKADYLNYCASCHGVDGKGNFLCTLLCKTIESRELGLARAHGPREMPV